IVEGAEAQRDRSVWVDRAERLPVDGILRVVPQAIVLNVVVVAVACGNRQDMAGGVVAEADERTVGGHREGNVGAVGHAALAVILVPTFVDGNFSFVAPRR